MSRCHRKMVPGVTISRIAARRSIGSVPASRASKARSGHVSRARALGLSRPATASWWRSMRISASFHHASRRDKLSSDTARETIRKISFKPTNRRSSHLRPGHDRPGACRTLHPALQGLCPGGAGFGTLNLLALADELRERGVGMVVLKQQIDTTTPTGRLVFHLLGAIDEFQRELIVEGTREGLAAARARGRTGGRKPKLNDRQAATVRRMYAATGPDGKRQHTVAEIAEAVGVHRTTIYDYLKKES